MATLTLPSTPRLTAASAAAGGGGGAEAVALSGDAAARFGSRNETMYPFLTATQRRDGQGRRPEHADYDAATLQLPKSFPTIVLGSGEKKTLSGGQAQWWVASCLYASMHPCLTRLRALTLVYIIGLSPWLTPRSALPWSLTLTLTLTLNPNLSLSPNPNPNPNPRSERYEGPGAACVAVAGTQRIAFAGAEPGRWSKSM